MPTLYRRLLDNLLPALLLAALAPAQASEAPALPDVSLVGIVNTGSLYDHAIVQAGSRERVTYRFDLIDDHWWLDAIGKDYILLSDGERSARVDLYHGSPTLVSNDSLARLSVKVTPELIQDEASHPQLEAGQQRRFYGVPQASQDDDSGDSLMARWQDTQDELNDPGMTRRFTGLPLSEVEWNAAAQESQELAGLDAGAALEDGQSRRFGPLPPPDEDDPEE